MTRLNVMGGSIAIGHPFGATGARITTTLVNELARRGGQFGLMTVCAAGRNGLRDGRGTRMTCRCAHASSVQDGIAVVTIDLPGEPVNKFSAAVIARVRRADDAARGERTP